MGEDGRKKRRAEEQLSPYSKDLEEPTLQPVPEPSVASTTTPGTKRPRARRNRGTPAPKSNTKGLLGKVFLTTQPEPTVDSGATAPPKAQVGAAQSNNTDLIAGVNRCFVRALERVVAKQANKDLTYLFKQYEKYMSKIRSDTRGGH